MSRPATVIVPTLSAARTERLLASLAAELDRHQAVVVDNGTGDRRFAELEDRFPTLEVVRLATNAGFSRAVNLAAARAEGEALVLLNDDCVCDSGFIDAIAAPLDPGAGIVMSAGVMRDWRDPELIDSAGMELDRTLLAFDYLNGEPLARLSQGVADPIGPSAGAAAFDRATFLAADGFDESLFAYWEDVDLVLRLLLEGGRCALAATALGDHEHSATLGSGSAEKNRLMGYGRGYVLRKWGVLSPTRLPGVISRELPICLGQLVIDRTAVGITARARGYRAAKTKRRYPAKALSGYPNPTPVAEMRRRLRRRSRLKSRGPEGVRQPSLDAGLRSLAIMHLAQVSGPSRSLERELEWLATQGQLDVLLPGDGPLAEQFAAFAKVEIVEYSTLTVPDGPAQALSTVAGLIRQQRALRKAIRAVRPSLVIVTSALMPAALIAARRERVPVIVYAGEILDEPRVTGSALRRRAGDRLLRLAARTATAVIACSDRVARQYIARGAKNVTTIHPPVGDRYANGDGDAFRRRHGIPADAPLIVAVGAITHGRGQDVLIRALPAIGAALGEVRCAIVGEPHPREVDRDYLDEIRSLATELAPGTVTFTGFEQQVEDTYAAANVVVNPARYEAFGRAAFEALRAGAPVVSTAVGAVPELLRDGTDALLVPVDDPGSLAQAVITALSDTALATVLAEEGRERADDGQGPAASLEAFAAVARSISPGPSVGMR